MAVTCVALTSSCSLDKEMLNVTSSVIKFDTVVPVTTEHTQMKDAYNINPFTADPVKTLHFAMLVQHTIFNFDIRALWRSVLSIIAPECRKLKIVG